MTAVQGLEYGLMAEGTALRLCGEWLKRVNQLRADLRIGLSNRVHPLQWNGRISVRCPRLVWLLLLLCSHFPPPKDLIRDAKFSLFAEFGKVALDGCHLPRH